MPRGKAPGPRKKVAKKGSVRIAIPDLTPTQKKKLKKVFGDLGITAVGPRRIPALIQIFQPVRKKK